MAAPLRLRHLHLPSTHPHYIPYRLASRVQEHLRRQHLDFKDSSTADRPPPTLISFTPSPIYTLGRRQTAPLTPAEVARLTAPLQISQSPHGGARSPPSLFSPQSGTATPIQDSNRNGGGDANTNVSLPPELLHSPRGGLTTYHGPGQIVLWPVLDLKSPLHKQFTVKCYARLLETTTISTLDRLFHIAAFTTDDPGVWVRPHRSYSSQAHHADEGEGEISKIAALGVHLRRHITALGTALNIAMPGPQVTDERVNPWARIVACGLEGRGVTSVAGEVDGGVGRVDELLSLSLSLSPRSGKKGEVADAGGGRERAVAGVWAGELARRAGIEGGVEEVRLEEAVRLMERLVEDGEGGEVGGDEREREYLQRMRDVVRGR